MREIIGEYNSGLKSLFESFRKRFGLNYNATLEYVDKMIEDKDYAILYFSSDISYSKELIEEINSTGVGQAYGFYKEGPLAFSSVEEIKEAVPRIVGDGGNKFIFVELEERSRFRLEDIPKSIFVKLGRDHKEMVVDIVKARKVVENETIRRIEKTDQDEFNVLYNKLYMKRWEMRNDIFVKNFKMNPSELSSICSSQRSNGAFVCIKDDRLVGFIIYEFLREQDSRAFEPVSVLTIRDIYVEEEFRRQGIATRLFREVTRIADKSLAKTIKFKTWSSDEETSKFVDSLNKRPLYTMYEIDI